MNRISVNDNYLDIEKNTVPLKNSSYFKQNDTQEDENNKSKIPRSCNVI